MKFGLKVNSLALITSALIKRTSIKRTLSSTFYSAIADMDLGRILFTVGKVDLIFMRVYSQRINNSFVWRTVAMSASATSKKQCECNCYS